MKRRIIPLNADWLFCPEDEPAFAEPDCEERRFTPVCLPHCNVELPYHNFDNAEYQFISWYRRHLSLSDELAGRHIFLDFDGVMMAAEVFVNGHRVARHEGGYVPFSADLTEHVRLGEGEDNVVAVRVDSRERNDTPPCGGMVDYLTFGGIYRDVHLRAVSPLFIENVFARPRDVLEREKALDVGGIL